MNLAAKFKKLLPTEPIQVGEVTTHNTDGTSTITLPDAGTIIVQGQDVTIGNNAFFQNNRIIGEAQALSTYTLEV